METLMDIGEVILDITPFAFVVVVTAAAAWMDRQARARRAKQVTRRRRAAYAAEVARAGARVKRQMGIEEMLRSETGAAVGDKPKAQPLRKLGGAFASPEAAALWQA